MDISSQLDDNFVLHASWGLDSLPGNTVRQNAVSADLATLRSVDPSPDGLSIHRVRDVRDLGDLSRILAGWERPDPLLLSFYEMAAPALLAPRSPRWFYVGFKPSSLQRRIAEPLLSDAKDLSRHKPTG